MTHRAEPFDSILTIRHPAALLSMIASLLDARGIRLWLSPAAHKLASVRQPPLGKCFLDTLPASEREKARAMFAECVLERRAVVGHFTYRIDGKVHQTKVRFSPCENGDVAVVVEAWLIPPGLARLSEREKEVLSALLRTDFNIPKVARELGVKRSTVESHRRKIYEKLGVSTPVALERLAIRAGLLE